MSNNDRIILDQVLDQKRQSIAAALTASEYFEIFTAEQILKDYDLGYDEILSGVIGGGADGGIDAMYLFINGDLLQEDTDLPAVRRNAHIDLVIIQAKTTAGFSENAVERLISVTQDLLDLSQPLTDFKSVYNEKLLDVMGRFRKAFETLAARFPTLTLSYYYASKGNEVHRNVQRKVDRLRNTVSQLFSSSMFSFEFLGARELLLMARRAPKTTHALDLAENPISSSGEVGFVCLVRLRDYYRFITDDKGNLLRSIFEANVRDYQGNNQVNEQIQESLGQSREEDFWWLNNGVTVVAAQATLSGKTLRIDSPEIVNGLQTSTVIYNFFRSKPSDDNRNLLVRVIVPEQPESRDRIIRATNSQTTIPPASLRATDKIHRDIEEYLKPYNLYYDRRKNYYKNEGRPMERVVSIPYLAQAVMSVVLQRPDDARARPSSLLSRNEDYRSLFSLDHPIKMYYVCATLLRRVESYLRSDKFDLLQKDRSNIRFHVAMYVAALAVGKPNPTKDDLAALSTDEILEAILESGIGRVLSIYQRMGATDQVAKGPDFSNEIKKDLAAQLSQSSGQGL